MRSLVLVAIVGVAAALAACLGEVPVEQRERPPNTDPQAGCALGCHGTTESNAPPRSVAGATETTSIAVGAHQAHLTEAGTWHRAVACADCHVVPADVGSPGHLDGDNRAELTFSVIAGAGASWDGTTCTTACHGGAALGGAHPQPVWTQVDGTQATCGSCHGAPPPAPHPADGNCAACHPTMEEGSLTFRDPARHIDGVVDVVGAGATGDCTSCHGSPTSAAPPRDLSGNTAPTARGVGAHAAHLAPSSWHREIACASCHVVPLTADAPGHLDGDNLAELVFDGLNPAATYGGTTCSNLYCHGTGRGNDGTATWTTPGALACGACHGLTGTNMSGEHRKHIAGEDLRCSECHAQVVDRTQTIIDAKLHVDGVHQVRMARGTFDPATRTCADTGCHGTERW